MMKIKDSRGKESVTLTFVYVAFALGSMAFAYTTVETNSADLTGYGAFVFGTLLPWVAREYTEKKGKDAEPN